MAADDGRDCHSCPVYQFCPVREGPCNLSKKIFSVLLVVFTLLSCTACSGLETLSDNLKGGVKQLGDDVAIGKSNTIITPYKSFEGSRTSDNTAFQASYNADVIGFDGQDISIGNINLKGKNCREITTHYSFPTISWNPPVDLH